MMFAEVEQRGLGANASTTACATPSSRASATGASRSRSTTRATWPTRCRRTNSRWSCRPSPNFGPTARASRRWPASRIGRRPRAIPTSCRRCPDSPDRRPTTSATWTRTTTRRSSAVKRTNTGATSTSTWAASSTPRDTSCTRGSGTCSSTTWASSAKRSRSANSSTRA